MSVWIDGGDKAAKKARLPGPEFEEHLRAMVAEVGDCEWYATLLQRN
tara:strand:+ start:3238 stop:3378 length:141 start_codon:yes stop_codon:yes gene_type:complete